MGGRKYEYQPTVKNYYRTQERFRSLEGFRKRELVSNDPIGSTIVVEQ